MNELLQNITYVSLILLASVFYFGGSVLKQLHPNNEFSPIILSTYRYFSKCRLVHNYKTHLIIIKQLKVTIPTPNS